MRTTYRMRAGRFLGILAAGLIILGVAAVLWALGLPGVAVSVFLTLGGLIALAGLWILARPPKVARLRDQDIEVRGLRTRWTDITEVGRVETTHGEAIVLRTKQPDQPILLPISWLVPKQVETLETTLRDKLNAAHGYTIWDGTAPGDTDGAE
ncbi:intracellular growth attenuator family protein [Kribbella shirazensis]|uniref:PH domain-containing protein n=1 Tax=Kribbella shirazensis TaxID=1105143 RepID=A0A7X5V5W5_9ACTN|nr:intracellular growth attenuator family protein [Kribbella shirazensis]NIK55198.1 hypothetical protein [Kribbella shirazensis]